jgi:hypothetical protein
MGFQSGFAVVWSAGAFVAVLLIGFAGLLWASVAFEKWLDDADRANESATPEVRGERPAPTSRAA